MAEARGFPRKTLMKSQKSIRHPLCREALQHFGVSPASAAQPLNPAVTRWIWPDRKTPPLSLATLCEVVLTAAYASKTNRTAELRIYLATKGLKIEDLAPQGAIQNTHSTEAHEGMLGAA